MVGTDYLTTLQLNDTSTWYLLAGNAIQATTNVIGEQTLGRASPACTARHKVMGPDGRTPATLKKTDDYYAKKQNYLVSRWQPT